MTVDLDEAYAALSALRRHNPCPSPALESVSVEALTAALAELSAARERILTLIDDGKQMRRYAAELLDNLTTAREEIARLRGFEPCRRKLGREHCGVARADHDRISAKRHRFIGGAFDATT